MTAQPPSGDMGQVVPTSNLALISLIAGILGISLVPVIGSIVAVIVGPMARREIRESAGTLGGEGLATAGMILGWVGIALSVFGLCIAGFVFVLPLCLGLSIFSLDATSALLPLLVVL